MIKGFYSAASALLARLEQQKMLSHNISNLSTPGFKQSYTSLTEFLEVDAYDPADRARGNQKPDLIGKMGLGVATTGDFIDYSQGSLRSTGQKLDLAVEGEGFFRIQTPEGERYTRDGRFQLDAESQLVTVDGFYVLNDGGQQIELPEGEIRISSSGEIFVDGAAEDQIGLAVFENPEEDLERGLSNLFQSETAPGGETPGTILQGYLEMSNIDPAAMMTELAKVARTYEAAQAMVQSQDQLLGRAISSLGRY